LQKKVLDYAERTYKTLGCSGISRVDFLINAETEEVFMNEVNPLPGSLYVHNFKKRGITGLDLVKKLISFAEEKFNQKKDLQHVFSSTVLESVNGNKIQ
jgi:D-alanine-D-alanine ligase